MNDVVVKEYPIKISRNPRIKGLVDKQKDYLKERDLNYSEAQLAHHARDRVAARIKLEKRAREIEKFKKQAETDSLTGLPNIRSFEKEIQTEVNRSRGTGSKSVLVTLDINDLKATNDTLGHSSGDRLILETAEALKQGCIEKLLETAKVLKKESRIIDLIFRGEKSDEFKVILPETDLEGANIWWKRVNQILTKKGLRIAAGAAEIDIEDYKKSIENSDKAMYHAKAISKKTGANLMLRYNQLNID